MNEPTEFATAGFLYNPETKSVLLHHRDGKTPYAPNKWAFFGGRAERGETPTEGFIRELHEEINLALKPDEVTPLRSYMNEELHIMRHVFFARSTVDISELALGEGAGFAWIPLSDIDNYDLTKMTVDDLQYFSNLNLST